VEDISFERAMVIFAHPDDAEVQCAGTVALWAAGGRKVTYVVMTKGDKGTQDPSTTAEALIKLRQEEQLQAAQELGVEKVLFLENGDGELEVGKEAYLDEAMTEHAPEGEHALAAGKIIVVDAAGVIIEIRDIEAAATEPTEPTEAEAKVAELTAQVEALVAEITALKEEKEIVETASAEFKAKMEKEFKALKSTITNAGVSITDKAPAHNKKSISAFDSFAEKKRNDYK